MTDPLVLRPIREADLDAVRRLQADSFTALGGDMHSPAQIAAHVAEVMAPDYAGELLSNNILVAEAPDGRLVATAGWCRVPDDPAVARLRKVFVAPDRAGQGLGRRMVEAAETAARAAGFRRFRVRANANAEAFYARLGYRPVERGEMPMAAGVALPTVIMVKG
ncbi:GNAT family N-acetyltransferase [Inquilinus limosus]|uniref:GNAT family N-acetyltransferase n=1 Tax=Inquilinus limosus TaxID=171674 RepID=UPI00042A550B|nr:GNAT family N-acetyltransferase [Inquilinus limosus]